MYVLLEDGTDPAIATHDPQLISDARMFIRRQGIKPDRYSFEMLMGVRRDLQQKLSSEGHPVRVYVPYGPSWYTYFTRRITGSPANLGIFAKRLD
jgi:proline dehydrogenase